MRSAAPWQDRSSRRREPKAGSNGVDTMRWIAVIAGLALLMAVTAGCKQPLFMTECDYEHYRKLAGGIPPDLDSNPTAASQPGLVAVVHKPATVLDPDREPRYISLQESIAIALEQGDLNGRSQFLNFTPGNVLADILPAGVGPGMLNFTEDIRVAA